MDQHKKAKRIERAVRLTFDSLQSHLKYTYSKSPEGIKFHKACVKEYAETLKILSELL